MKSEYLPLNPLHSRFTLFTFGFAVYEYCVSSVHTHTHAEPEHELKNIFFFSEIEKKNKIYDIQYLSILPISVNAIHEERRMQRAGSEWCRQAVEVHSRLRIFHISI